MRIDTRQHSQTSKLPPAVIPPLRYALLPVLLVLGLIAGNCGTSTNNVYTAIGQPPEEQAGAAPGFDGAFLPRPSELSSESTVPRQAAYVPDDLWKHAAGLEYTLPHQLISEDGSDAVFNGAWNNESPSPDDMAYCIYGFTATGFDRDSQVRLIWHSSNPDPSTIWLGLANWGQDTWDWYSVDASYIAYPPTMAPYLDAGEAMVAVVACNNTKSWLDYVLLGPNMIAELLPSCDCGIAPFTATYSAAGSSALVGSIDEYEWDWDNDGEYEYNSGSSSSVNHTYSEAGEHIATVRVTNSAVGDQATASADVEALSSWARTWGRDNDQKSYNVAYDGADHLYVSGMDALGGRILTKVNLNGDVAWVKDWATSDQLYLYAWDITVSANGDIYIVGTKEKPANDFDLLLLCWDQHGSLKWAKTWGSEDTENGYGIATYDEDIYICGNSDGFSANPAALLVKLDASGNEQWARILGGAAHENYGDIIITYHAIGQFPLIHTGGSTDSFSPSDAALYTCHTASGTLLKARALAGTEFDGTHSMAVSGLQGDQLVFADIVGSTNSYITVAAVDDDALTMAKRIDGGMTDRVRAMCFTGAGDILLCGSAIPSYPPQDGLLMAISPDGSVLSTEYWGTEGDADEFWDMAAIPGSGLFLCGYGINSVDGSWTSATRTAVDVTATWNTLNETEQDVSGTVETISIDVTDTTSEMVIDTGGGDSDALLLSRPML